MNSLPKVSICIPAYNQTEYLSKTLDSILIQEYTDYEVIITDDSPDSSVEELVKRYDFNGRLKYFRNKERRGTPANWNEAISLATGEYIKIVHHDDWFAHSKSLQLFVELLDRNPEVDFAFSNCISVQGKKEYPFLIRPENLMSLRGSPFNLILGNFIGTPSVTIYRKHFLGRFDKALKWLVDFEFYIQILDNNPKFEFSPDTLMKICSKGVHQVTNECLNNKDVELPEYIYLYEKYFNRFKLENKHLEFLQELFSKYQINNMDDLKSLNLISEIPESFGLIFSISKRIKSLVKKIILYPYKKIKLLNSKLFKGKIKAFKKSYSQCGEDLIIDFIFSCLKIDKPSYLDIGAHHPLLLSNTALFYNKGSHGINIEPNPNLIGEFNKLRKKDINLNIGIAKKNDELTFYIMSVPTMSTFSLEEAKKLEQETSMRIVEQKKIFVKNIQSILDEYNKGGFPDFLSLDVEGFEDEILESIDFEKKYPKVICLETITYSESNEEKKEIQRIAFLLEKGYFVYGETYINTIFVMESDWRIR